MSKQGKKANYTRKQRAFLDGIEAGLPEKKALSEAGYSMNNAAAQLADLLKKPHIRTEYDKIMAQRRELLALEAERISLEIARVALFDPRKLFDPETGKFIAPHQWPDEVAAAVAGIDITTNQKTGAVTYKLKFWDKGRSLELAAKHLNLVRGGSDKAPDGEEEGEEMVLTLRTQDGKELNFTANAQVIGMEQFRKGAKQ